MTSLHRCAVGLLYLTCVACAHDDGKKPSEPEPSGPPAAVDNLAIHTVGQISVGLTWRLPDDAEGMRAARYDLRHASEPISEGNWDEAVRAGAIAEPHPGVREYCTVDGLEPSMRYFFCIRVADADSTWSDISNVVDAWTKSELIRLTTSAVGGAWHPQWSPDGSRIAFDADWVESFTYQIYAVSPDGGTPTQITNLPFGAMDASWSPDGTRIAFVAYSEEGLSARYGLSILNVAHDSEPTVLIPAGPLSISGPSWSPDGQRIAYHTTLFDPPVIECTTYVANAVTGSTELVVEDAMNPAWSPDGSVIVFASTWTGDSAIYVIPAAGGEAVQLMDDPGIGTSPAWSPDGASIAFSSNRTGTYDIWVMDATGENLRQLTFDSGSEVGPSWAPNGRRIAYSSSPGGALSDIWILYLE